MSCQCWSCGRGTSCDVEFCAKCCESLRVDREGAARAAMSVKVSDKFPLTSAIERLKAAASNYGVAADSDSDRRWQVALEKVESAELAIRLSIAKAIRVAEESMRERCALLHEQIDTGKDRDGAGMAAVIKYRDAIRQLPLENA